MGNITDTTIDARRHLLPAAWALLIAQLLHVAAAFVSPRGDDAEERAGEGVIGLPLGLIAIITTIVVIVGVRRGRSWAPTLASLTGFSVGAGFLLYHGFPGHSWATNPYWGTANVVDWAGFLVCVVAGAWCAWAGWPRVSQPAQVA